MKLNFGSGNDIYKGWDNADIQKGKGIAYSFDFNKYPYPLKDNTYDFIAARQVLQLLNSPDKCLDELHRIAKPGAEVFITTSYWHNKGSHNDIKTRFYFNERSIALYVDHVCDINKRGKYKIIKIWREPTWVGKLLVSEWLRSKVDLFVSGIYSNVCTKLKVLKR